jgi:putative hydrolase of the HAD superfamily
MAIKNIIFDIGKVLVSFEPDENMKRLGLREDERKAVNAVLFENELWDMADEGVYSSEEILRRAIAGAPEYESAVRRAWDGVGGSIELLDYAVPWMDDLKSRGYHLYILSNYGEHTLEKTRHKMAFLPYMDGVLFSCHCKRMKPQREIYEKLLKDFGLEASESVFLDDRKVNVDGAAACGIYGILFKDYESAKQELDMLLNHYK